MLNIKLRKFSMNKPFILDKQEQKKETVELTPEQLKNIAGGMHSTPPDSLCEDEDGNPKWDD